MTNPEWSGIRPRYFGANQEDEKNLVQTYSRLTLERKPFSGYSGTNRDSRLCGNHGNLKRVDGLLSGSQHQQPIHSFLDFPNALLKLRNDERPVVIFH